jgi:solute carrier family 12 sodium/potassium/chloride transporter 2
MVSSSLGKPDRSRPTLDELLEDEKAIPRNELYDAENGRNGGSMLPGVKAEGSPIKFGWFDGVYMRCLLNIWGVMLFLRLTWVIGQAGLIEGLAIITLSNIVTLITSISMSAVSTNGQIKAGGIYYMISRSLGPEFGGAIGLMFTLANSIAVSMYLIGFCEALLDMFEQYITDFNGIIDSVDRINDVRLVGSISLVLILGLAIVGMDWVTRVQMGLLFLLLVSQVDFIIGSFLPASDEEKSKGFVGYNGTVMSQNLWSGYTADAHGNTNNFFSVFAVFFPAVTGIVAGANLSGDLKDPGVAIPKGTLLAIATTYVTYIIYGIMIAGCSLRHASGILEEVHFGTDLFTETVGAELNITHPFDDCTTRSCQYGISVSQQMMEVISAWGPLIYAGCFAATLSSAIASLVGAPRVFQAVAKDKLFPGISSFAEGWGANNDPVRGYILVFIISLICVLIGDLNLVSGLLSNFFIAAYALINFSVFHASITNSPGWRPSFKCYNHWVSLLGTILCIVVMFLMDYKTALVTFVCVLILYTYVHFRKPNVNWGSSSQSQSFVSALKAIQTLTKVEDHVKNYRPKVMVLSGTPGDRPALLDFANLLTKRLSLLACADVVSPDMDWNNMADTRDRANRWLNDNHIKAFYTLTRNNSFSEGVRAVVELCGLGKLSPNMTLMGFKDNWRESLEDTEEYVKALQASVDLRLSIGIFRIHGGLDITSLSGHSERLVALTRRRKNSEVTDWDSADAQCSESNVSFDSHGGTENERGKSESTSGVLNVFRRMSLKGMPSLKAADPPLDEALVERVTQFRNKDVKEGVIDVYWLYDDGGLPLLLPHILTTRTKFAKCKLRVFFLSEKSEDIDAVTRSMARLLEKFRIDVQDIIVLTHLTDRATRKSRDEFAELIAPADLDEGALNCYREKTNFHLRIAEVVRQNSASAQLVVMSLPLSKKVGNSLPLPPALYMAWLDYMTTGMPPFLLVRGNQESVLTFYS